MSKVKTGNSQKASRSRYDSNLRSNLRHSHQFRDRGGLDLLDSGSKNVNLMSKRFLESQSSSRLPQILNQRSVSQSRMVDSRSTSQNLDVINSTTMLEKKNTSNNLLQVRQNLQTDGDSVHQTSAKENIGSKRTARSVALNSVSRGGHKAQEE